ncbi:MAG: hypothetical protein HFE30_00170 [Clostridiales bacterium]|nr:hypothetical protein [Clostridiales bacterium]
MKNIKISALILAIFIYSSISINLTSCNYANVSGNRDNDIFSKSGDNAEKLSDVQKIMSCLYDNLKTKDGKIFLAFGEEDTLTVKNFNTLILEDQLNLSTDRYSFVIDDNVLSVLRQDDAYGGIGYGKEWCVWLEVAIKNLNTGEITEPSEIGMILYKSYEADARFRRDISIDIIESEIYEK